MTTDRKSDTFTTTSVPDPQQRSICTAEATSQTILTAEREAEIRPDELQAASACVNHRGRGGYQPFCAHCLWTYAAVKEHDNRLRQQVAQLRTVCAEAYQLAGAYDAPVEALDNLLCAANGKPLLHETFLPVQNQWEKKVAQLEAAWDVLSGDSEERIFNLEAERDAAKLQADLRLGVIEKLEAQLAAAQARIKELEG